MRRSYLIALSLLAASTLGACKKDKVETKADLLAGKKWQTTAITATFSGGQTGSQDIFTLLSACGKDNYLLFNATKTLEVNEGQLVCADQPQTATGTWEISSDQNQLYLSLPQLGGLFALPMDIVELSAAKMVLKNTLVQDEVTTVTTTTFVAQ